MNDNNSPIFYEVKIEDEVVSDFLDAIETGRRPVCDIEAIHYSTNMSLLGMLSYKLGRSVTWNGAPPGGVTVITSC